MIYSFLFSFRLFFILNIASGIFACGNHPSNPQNLSKKAFSFLSIDEGIQKITHDTLDGFFQKVGLLDMSLQMNRKQNCLDPKICLHEYKNYLAESVLAFTESEKKIMTQTMDSCFALIFNKFPALNIPAIDLIKILPNHYGASVYYTRENAVIIPDNVLVSGTIGSLLPVMLHELSHIILRYNDNLKTSLYGIIGFNKLGKPIRYAQSIKDRILVNPDGLDNSFFIDIDLGDRKVKAVPVLVSSKSAPSEHIQGFMNYIKFDLYEIIEKNDHYLVTSSDNRFSKLSPNSMESFFNQVKENTQYIIHPDEIIADNFMMLLITERDDTIENFNQEGQKLLKDLKTIFKNN